MPDPRDSELLKVAREFCPAIVFVNLHHQITSCNAAAAALLGYESAAQLIGQPVESLGFGEIHEDLVCRAGATTTAVHRDGHLIPIIVSAAEIDGTKEGHVLVLHDIREQIKLRAREVARERWRVAGGAAAAFVHEIGNPLYSLDLHAQVLERTLQGRAPDEGAALRSVDAIRSELARLLALTEAFRCRTPLVELTFEPVSIHALLEEVLRDHAVLFVAHDVRVERALDAADSVVRADADKLKQVLINLIKNAIEAMPTGGVLGLRTTCVDGGVEVRVRDSGDGIPDHVDPYEPFHTTKVNGTGLGLAICRQILSLHEGSLRHESGERPGTTFIVSLPLAVGS